jgi:hypothetical protein
MTRSSIAPLSCIYNALPGSGQAICNANLPRGGLYPTGLTVRDIRAHLEDVYGLQLSPDLISRVTDAVLDELREWQTRALERMYPIVIFDALRVKIRDAPFRDIAAQYPAGQWTVAWSRPRPFT